MWGDNSSGISCISASIASRGSDGLYSGLSFQGCITKHKFVYHMHSEAKQTEMLQFGAEKGLLQGQARRTGSSCSKPPTPWWFWGKSFYLQNLGWGLQGTWPSSDWWWGKMAVFQESCSQPKVAILHLGGSFSSCRRTQRYCYVYSLRRNQHPAPRLRYCVLIAPLLFLQPLPSLISNSLNLPFGTPGDLGGWNLYPANKK